MDFLPDLFLSACFCNFICCLYPVKHTFFNKSGQSEALYKTIRFTFLSMSLWLCLAIQSSDIYSIFGNLFPTFASGLNLFLCGLGMQSETNAIRDLSTGVFGFFALQFFPEVLVKVLACGLTVRSFAGAWEDVWTIRGKADWTQFDIVEYSANFGNCALWVWLTGGDLDYLCFFTFLLGLVPCGFVCFWYLGEMIKNSTNKKRN